MAALALGELKDPRAVEPLIIALKDKNGSVRWEAALSLRRLKDPRAVEPLIAALADENYYVPGFARLALHEIIGQDFGPDQVKWQKWWEKHKHKFKKN